MIQNQLLKKLLLLFCGFCLYGISQAQTITGKVTDENNMPLSGVTVQIKNSTKGTSTNSNGEFSIAAPQGATLVLSFIGGLEEFLIEKYFSFRGLVFQYYRHIFTKRLTK
jgi:hypothetical protein